MFPVGCETKIRSVEINRGARLKRSLLVALEPMNMQQIDILQRKKRNQIPHRVGMRCIKKLCRSRSFLDWLDSRIKNWLFLFSNQIYFFTVDNHLEGFQRVYAIHSMKVPTFHTSGLNWNHFQLYTENRSHLNITSENNKIPCSVLPVGRKFHMCTKQNIPLVRFCRLKFSTDIVSCFSICRIRKCGLYDYLFDRQTYQSGSAHWI